MKDNAFFRRMYRIDRVGDDWHRELLLRGVKLGGAGGGGSDNHPDDDETEAS